MFQEFELDNQFRRKYFQFQSPLAIRIFQHL